MNFLTSICFLLVCCLATQTYSLAVEVNDKSQPRAASNDDAMERNMRSAMAKMRSVKPEIVGAQPRPCREVEKLVNYVIPIDPVLKQEVFKKCW